MTPDQHFSAILFVMCITGIVCQSWLEDAYRWLYSQRKSSYLSGLSAETEKAVVEALNEMAARKFVSGVLQTLGFCVLIFVLCYRVG